MSTWRDLKRDAKQSVHDCFAVPALYTAPNASPVAVHVRHHTRVVQYGDLDREGYAQVVQDVNQIIFLSCEADPVKRGVVEFEDGSQYIIDTVQPSLDGLTVTCDVAQKKVRP